MALHYGRDLRDYLTGNLNEDDYTSSLKVSEAILIQSDWKQVG